MTSLNGMDNQLITLVQVMMEEARANNPLGRPGCPVPRIEIVNDCGVSLEWF